MPLKKIRFFCRLSWFFLLAMLLLLQGLALVSDAQAEPKAEVPETSHDFGQVREDMTLVHDFAVKNTGNENLQILLVDPDCACTVAKYDKVIPPGGTGKVTLQIQPFSVVHAFKKKTYVRFNSPDPSSVTLVVTGNAQKSIDIQPSHIVRFRGAPKDDLTAQIKLTSHLPFPWEITKIKNSQPDKYDATLKTEKPGKEYVLEVKNKSLEEGHYAGMIQLSTNVVHKPKIIIRVIADFYPEAVRP
jgi:hypothetical protein